MMIAALSSIYVDGDLEVVLWKSVKDDSGDPDSLRSW